MPNAEYIIRSRACHLNKTFNPFRVCEGMNLRRTKL
jgi:hypothetical protein